MGLPARGTADWTGEPEGDRKLPGICKRGVASIAQLLGLNSQIVEKTGVWAIWYDSCSSEFTPHIATRNCNTQFNSTF